MQLIEKYFDKIYLLNLEKDKERLENITKVFNGLGLSKVQRWNAFTPETSTDMKEDHNLEPPYLACLKSHLTMIQDAYNNGYEKILIIEDDIIPIKDFHSKVYDFLGTVPENWDLLYFSFIPLNEDRSSWSYIDEEKTKHSNDTVLYNDGIIKAKEFWSLMAYALNRRMMKTILDFYNNNTLIELDRYFVDYIQKDERFNAYGFIPQPFVGVDNYSNNTQIEEKIFERSSHPNHRHKY
jgi:GR25 family glycosyltransferase involved in LPS biosynthesis